jgi:hypothetical protein
MKILILVLLAYSTLSLANPKPYMVCLGTEEAYIHKNKIGGAYYKLNQTIISALVQLSDTTKMSPKSLKHVCSKRFVSLEILKLILTEKESIFYTTKNKKNIAQYSVDNNSIKELQEKSIHIFISFINSIQAQLNGPHCLLKIIPELNKFFEQMRYTLEDVGVKSIIKTLKNPKVIFEKLHSIPTNTSC